jgi:probable HAF family extracellular repeat protein
MSSARPPSARADVDGGPPNDRSKAVSTPKHRASPVSSLAQRLVAVATLGVGLGSARCGIDDRTPGVASSQGGSAGSGVAGTFGESAGSSGSAGIEQGGSPSENAGGGGSAGTGGSAGGDAGATARGCGSAGGECCTDGPRCDAGLGCDEASGLCAACAAFAGIGILEGFTSSVAQGISGDGRVVVGYAENLAGVTMAFRTEWAVGGPPVPLGVLPGGASSQARAASYDGYAVVGDSESSNGLRGFRWAAGTLTDLGTWATGDLESSAADVSADGNAVALTSTASDGVTRLAYRWLLGGDKLPIIGMEEARGISADGNAWVGNRLGASGNEAVLGTSAAIVPLGTLSGDTVAFARALSADGAVAIGVSGSCGCRGFFWRDGVIEVSDGLERALAVSRNGRVIGGSMVGTGCSGGRAATWEPAPGMRPVACGLLPDGIIPNGWSLSSVNAVSDDGTVIAGEGIDPALASEGWVAVLGPDCRTQ